MAASVASSAHHCLIGFDRESESLRSAGAFARAPARSDSPFAATATPPNSRRYAQASARRLPGWDCASLQRILALQIALDVWLVMRRRQKPTPRARLLFDRLAKRPVESCQGQTVQTVPVKRLNPINFRVRATVGTKSASPPFR